MIKIGFDLCVHSPVQVLVAINKIEADHKVNLEEGEGVIEDVGDETMAALLEQDMTVDINKTKEVFQ